MKVPEQFMIPIGAEATKAIGRCADTWTDSDVAELRAMLPMDYHAVPLDSLRRQWINIRKRGTDGYRVNGHGPAVGSRKSKLPAINAEYAAYIASDGWKAKRQRWLDFWESRCCICNSKSNLNVHHRTYENVPVERLIDCVVLCRECHELYEIDKIELELIR